MRPRFAPPRPRSRSTALVAVLALIAALLAGVAASVPASAAPVATTGSAGSVDASIRPMTLTGFDAGNIIDDAVFFNSGTMTEAQIQSFFNSKVSSCQSGYTCLKDFRQTTSNRPADAMCKGYTGGANESAARIIYKTAQSCGINPQVLIVMLQKEQGLVTHTWPSNWRYDAALGMDCPDTPSGCSAAYSGFFSQIYGGSWQMKRYANPPGTSAFFTWYAPGNTWQVLYNPNRACGSSGVAIRNQATANLYYYTPYQPNAAAMRAGYGEGDGCSAYGNRNFYNYFTDWFGPTKAALVSGAIATEWNRLGGLYSVLGAAKSPAMRTSVNGGGLVQQFAGGTIWLQDGASLAYAMGYGAYRDAYLAAGGEAGSWGWPTGRASCGLTAGGCSMYFDKGVGYYSPDAGTFLVPMAMIKRYGDLRGPAGSVGYPTAAASYLRDTIAQEFQGATIVQSRSGTILLTGVIRDTWRVFGGFGGSLGYPTADASTSAVNGGGTLQKFSAGEIWQTSAGAFAMGNGPFRSDYVAAGAEGGSWGWPISNAVCDTNGCTMRFQNATAAFTSATGSVLISPTTAAEWSRLGGVASLGYPRAAATASTANGGGLVQAFDGGTMWESPAGAFAMGNGAFRTGYINAGAESGSWGWPTSSATCGLPAGGCTMQFQNGTVGYTGSTGSVLMSTAVATEWTRLGGANGLGYPRTAAVSSAANGGGTVQAFTGGTIWESPAGAFAMGNGPFRTGYLAAGAESGTWGWPTASASCDVTGCTMPFQNGIVGYTASTGSVLMSPKVAAEWTRLGGAAGIGYPRTAATSSPVNGGGTVQAFTGGTIWESPAGAFAMGNGPLRTAYLASGAESGTWGWPTSSATCDQNGCTMPFQKGTIGFTSLTGAVLVPTGKVLETWTARGGVSGALGYPQSPATTSGTVTQQKFAGGTIRFDSTTGAVTVG